MPISLVTYLLTDRRRRAGDPVPCPPPRAFWQDWGSQKVGIQVQWHWGSRVGGASLAPWAGAVPMSWGSCEFLRMSSTQSSLQREWGRSVIVHATQSACGRGAGPQRASAQQVRLPSAPNLP